MSAPPLRKRLKRWLRAKLLSALLQVLRWLPLGWARALGRAAGGLAYHLARGTRRLGERHLSVAFPEADAAFVRRTLRACFRGLGENLMENVVAHRLDGRLAEYVAIEGEACLEAALAEGRGVIVVTAHLGNWELAARALVARGREVVAIARRFHDPGLGRLVERHRAEGGVKTLLRGERSTPFRMVRHLKRGGALFMLVDQDTDVPSLFAPFFGRLAKTPRAPADLSLRLGAPVVAGFIERREGGHRLRFERIEAPRSGDAERDAVKLTEAINRAIEAEIRRRPADWVWFHRRWRTPPPPGA